MYNKFQILASGDLYLRPETCSESKIWHVCSYLRHKQKLFSRLNDFMTCSERFNTQSEGVHISALEHCRKIKFTIYYECSPDTHIHK